MFNKKYAVILFMLLTGNDDPLCWTTVGTLSIENEEKKKKIAKGRSIHIKEDGKTKICSIGLERGKRIKINCI